MPAVRPRLAALALAVSIASPGCRCGGSTAPGRPALPPDDDAEAPLLVRAGDAAPRPAARCALTPPRWLVPVADAAAELTPTVEGGALAFGDGGAPWGAWIDRRSGQLVVAPPRGDALRSPLGPGETNAPVLAAHGGRAVVVTVAQTAGARVHRVAVADESGLRELFAQPERPDDGLTVAVAPTRAGALVAWDDDRDDLGGQVMTQLVGAAEIAAGAALAAPPVARAVSPPELDAQDPVLVATPAGGAVVFWLASHELDASVASRTASDVYARALDPTGAPAGPAVRVTASPAYRFAVTALADRAAVWVAWRVADEADQESRGDGGAVVLQRLGADLRPASSAAVLTADRAQTSGAPAIVRDGAGVTVFWAERRGEGSVTVRRAVEPDGRVVRAAQDEPALAAEVPVAGSVDAATVVLRGPRGEPGVATARCPPVAPAVADAPDGA